MIWCAFKFKKIKIYLIDIIYIRVNMRYILKLLQIIYSIYAFLVFLILMFILFPLIFVASFFGKIKGGNAIYTICRFWAAACLALWGIRHENIFEGTYNKNRPYVFVFNHLSYLDIPLLLVTFRYQKIRILGKAEMSKFPVFGFIYRNAVVPVMRTKAEDRFKSIYILKSVLKKNISIVIAPEGTFNMTPRPLKDFYDGAFKIAIDTNTPIKPVLFLDAYSRLNYKSIFSLTPGKSRAVFLDDVETACYMKEDLQNLKQQVYQLMEACLIKHNATWVKQEIDDRAR
jgi:1-acyl-sn-glycerol-3-phosphate acyltransferase